MLPRPIVVSACLALAACGGGQTKPSTDAAARDAAIADTIVARLRDYAQRGANRLDTAVIAQMYAREPGVGVAICENTSCYHSVDEYLRESAQVFAQYDSARLGLTDEKVVVLGPDAALATPTFTSVLYPKRGRPQTYQGIWATLWRRGPGGWRITWELSSEVAVAKPAHLGALTKP